jgi:hypothetical protein
MRHDMQKLRIIERTAQSWGLRHEVHSVLRPSRCIGQAVEKDAGEHFVVDYSAQVAHTRSGVGSNQNIWEAK